MSDWCPECECVAKNCVCPDWHRHTMNKIILFGHCACPSCVNIKSWLESKHIQFDYVNVWDNPDKANLYGVKSVPTIIIREQYLVNPTILQLKNILKQTTL